MKHLKKFEYYDTTGMEPVSDKELKHLSKNIGKNPKILVDLRSRLRSDDKIDYNESLKELILNNLPILNNFKEYLRNNFIAFNYEKEELNKNYVINLEFDINAKHKKVKINLEFYINDNEYGNMDDMEDDLMSAINDERLGKELQADAEYLEKLIIYKIVNIEDLKQYFSIINLKIEKFIEYVKSKYGANLL